jgi:hypothetical protein
MRAAGPFMVTCHGDRVMVTPHELAFWVSRGTPSMATIVRSRALLLLAKELGLEGLDAEVLEAFAVSSTGPRDLILFSIAVSLQRQQEPPPGQKESTPQ